MLILFLYKRCVLEDVYTKFMEFSQINVINYFIVLVDGIYEAKCARNLKELKMIKAKRTRDRNVPCKSNQNGT